MYLIVILIALALLQVWGAQNPLHRDDIFFHWVDDSKQWSWLRNKPYLPLLWALAIPVITVVLVSALLPGWLWMILSIVVLLYSLGRGEFAPHIEPYTAACTDNRWPDAITEAQRQGINLEGIEENSWSDLHQKILGESAYQGFERLFAVLFWFVLFGPAGALLYRLSFLYAQKIPSDAYAKRWLWALEWPAVRALGASFAVTGNFVGCINRWKIYVFCQTRDSVYILRETVLGALSVDDELMQSCDCSQREISALKRLYTRTLWFWLVVIALSSLLF